MNVFTRIFGSKSPAGGSKDKAALRQKLSPPVRKRLEKGIDVTTECVTIMQRCHTSQEIFDGFRRCRTLLANMNHPLSQAVDMILKTEGTDMLDQTHICGLRDRFLSNCKAFLAATGG